MGTRSVTLQATAVAIVLATAPPTHAQHFSPYSDFQAMSVSQLSTLRVKLTYAMDAGPPAQSVLFSTSQGNLDITLFTPYRRPSLLYASDDLDPGTLLRPRRPSRQ